MRVLLLLLALGGCAAKEPPPAPAAVPLPPPVESSCVSTCEHDNQMRAVSADMITRDCEARCAADAG